MASSEKPFFSTRRERELLDALDPARVPAHVGVIMDGNGRWAAKRHLPRVAGHRAGVKAIREVIASAIETGVRHLTIYSFSSENWRRPADEVSHLMGLFVEVLHRELASLHRMGVRVRVIGRMDELPDATRVAFERAIADTAKNDRLTLLVALNYGGRAEIADAARRLVEDVIAGNLDVGDVDEGAIAERLYVPDVPDPDLVIRTSGEVRMSNFLLWEAAYAEFWSTAVLWPDFRRYDFLKALVDFQRRGRRFGGSE